MSKYKVGAKVKVRNDLEVGKEYGGIKVQPEMSRRVGRFVTIRSVASTGNYRVNESVYAFSNEMFEQIEPKEMTVAEIEKELGYPVKIIKE